MDAVTGEVGSCQTIPVLRGNSGSASTFSHISRPAGQLNASDLPAAFCLTSLAVFCRLSPAHPGKRDTRCKN